VWHPCEREDRKSMKKVSYLPLLVEKDEVGIQHEREPE
jgi:hypothetical protein